MHTFGCKNPNKRASYVFFLLFAGALLTYRGYLLGFGPVKNTPRAANQDTAGQYNKKSIFGGESLIIYYQLARIYYSLYMII